MKTRDWSGAFTHIADATARERLHDLIGLGDPAVPRPAHAPAATELEQTIESVHLCPHFVAPDAVVATNAEQAARRPPATPATSVAR